MGLTREELWQGIYDRLKMVCPGDPFVLESRVAVELALVVAEPLIRADERERSAAQNYIDRKVIRSEAFEEAARAVERMATDPVTPLSREEAGCYLHAARRVREARHDHPRPH